MNQNDAAIIQGLKEYIEVLRAQRNGMVELLQHVEVIMTLIEPRNDKAAYLECLDRVRKVIWDSAARPPDAPKQGEP